MKIGDKIRNARINKDMSQEELSFFGAENHVFASFLLAVVTNL